MKKLTNKKVLRAIYAAKILSSTRSSISNTFPFRGNVQFFKLKKRKDR